jgi:hypothetical protein
MVPNIAVPNSDKTSQCRIQTKRHSAEFRQNVTVPKRHFVDVLLCRTVDVLMFLDVEPTKRRCYRGSTHQNVEK